MTNKEIIVVQDVLNIFSDNNSLYIDIDDIRTLIRDRRVCYTDVAEVDGSDKIEEAFSNIDSIKTSDYELSGILIASGRVTLKDTENIHNCLRNKLGENMESLFCVLDDDSLGNDKIRITLILFSDN